MFDVATGLYYMFYSAVQEGRRRKKSRRDLQGGEGGVDFPTNIAGVLLSMGCPNTGVAPLRDMQSSWHICHCFDLVKLINRAKLILTTQPNIG